MTTTAGPARPTDRWRRWLRAAPLLALLLAVAAAALLALGPLGWRIGWWHFRFAFFGALSFALGGLLLGIIDSVVGFQVPELRNTIAFALIVLVLVVRPGGLLGRHETKKV